MTKNNDISGAEKEIKAYWDAQYLKNNTRWDLGYASTPIKEYIDQLADKSIKILIPGAGNAYEAEYLFLRGFKNVYVLDISSVAISSFKKRFPDFPDKHLINQNFFTHNDRYNLIIEQTFFCAINRADRSKYVEKTYNLLNKNGKLAGLLFNHEFDKEGPPFGGSPEEYEGLFSPPYKIKTFQVSYNSIKPRNKGEHFIIFVKE